MNFTCKKTENCFADSQTYEYKIPITAEAFKELLIPKAALPRCAQNAETGSASASDRQTFPIDRNIPDIGEGWLIRCNSKLRRPVFLAEKAGIKMKGILAGDILRVSFLNEAWETYKTEFEDLLKKL